MEAPKRLAIFVPSMRSGGAERTTLKLAQELAKRGEFTIDLVLAKAEGPYLAEVPDTVRIVDLKASRVLLSFLPLVGYLRRERPVALLSALNHANIVALWAKRWAGVDTRLIVSERNTLSIGAKQATSQFGRWMPQFVKRFYPWADRVVAVSTGVAEDLAQFTGFPRDRIEVIYNPVVTPEVAQKAKASIDHAWFGAGQLPVVLAVGRLKPQKDFPTLIRAFATVQQTHPARLLILGEGPERPALEALIEELNLQAVVSLPGFVANPYAYMSQAAVFVLSSRWEGLPGVLIEALYCGVPLISTDCPSGAREILKDGKYGRLIPVGDETALVQALSAALEGKIAAPPQESWRSFTPEAVVNQYLNLLVGA